MSAMSRPVTIAVEGVCRSGKSTLLRNIEGRENFTTVQRDDEIFYDEDDEVVEPWQYFFDVPSVRGFRFIQTCMLRHVEDMTKEVQTTFKVVEGSINTTRYVDLKLAASLGMEDDDVDVVKRWYKVLSKEPSLTPDYFIVLSPSRKEWTRRLATNAVLAKHCKPHETKNSWEGYMAKFQGMEQFREKVVVVDSDYPGQVVEDFLQMLTEKFIV